MPDLTALFSELIRYETELWNAVDARLRGDCDLPLTRFEPMQIIGRRKACRVHDIAEELSITVGGTSKLVDRIEAFGHCRRRPNPGDRRSSLIELTPPANGCSPAPPKPSTMNSGSVSDPRSPSVHCSNSAPPWPSSAPTKATLAPPPGLPSRASRP